MAEARAAGCPGAARRLTRNHGHRFSAGDGSPGAPEDLRPGEYISVLQVLHEECSLFSTDERFWERREPRRMYYLPGTIKPLRIVSVCLPYVLVEKPGGQHKTLDARRYRLARLTEQFGRAAFEKMKPRNNESKPGAETPIQSPST